MQRAKKSIISKVALKEMLIRDLPELLKEDPLLKDYVASLFKENFADKRTTEEEIKALLEEIKNLRIESEKRWEEHSKRLEEHSQILKEHSKRLEEHSKKLEELSQGNKILMEEILALRKRQDVQISALGARWGIKSEKTFRNAVKGLLEETFGVKVEHYETTDLEGEVFEGFPGKRVEIDLIIRDGELIVAEIKSSVSPGDVLLFERKVKVFEKKEGKKVTRKIIISPMLDREAKSFCKSLGITFYTDVPDREEGL
ncbi:hypothetical protein THC_1627 [Caldimicrobium thiodismutans]|uniref:DUF3782 domain-containing protein n=1 Tax=Caldimicrobium thiodismutans TaxID=1653476 RepID=A0A0U5AJD1_9BACT|nr:DUF3782 domain-containing protein [Caldimicrobium thiodismutans]BAU23991.1 hypothetical protein THC_1627 [Caldimicrobium thiodismutans]